MKAPILRRVPPAGAPIAGAALRHLATRADPAGGLAERLGAERVDLLASGREALRVAVEHLAKRSGRAEVVVPAYTCFSVPSAIVAAGLRVRLVDVTRRGWIDCDALKRLPLERAAAVVVCNLFGIAEPTAKVAKLAREAGAALVDDAAQALGAVSGEGPAGGRGDLGVLSFGRGKPLAALGGGGLVWSRESPPSAPPVVPTPRRLVGFLRALAHDAALTPAMFRWIAAIPGLHVGESSFEPVFRRGAISGADLALLAALLPGLDEAARRSRQRALALAKEISAETPLEPLLAPQGETAVYPRLGLLAADPEAREQVLSRFLRLGEGASRMYPSSLDALIPLQRHLAGEPHCPGARELAERILTLPTGSGDPAALARRAIPDSPKCWAPGRPS